MDVSRTHWSQVDAARRGNREAFESIVHKYRPVLLAYFVRRGFPGEAEDLAQEVFLQLLSSALERADPRRGRFRALLLTVARNTIGHHLERRDAVKRGGGQRLQPLGDREVAAEQAEAEAEFERAWVHRLVELALERLEREHPNYFVAVKGALFEGRSQEQLAVELGYSPTNLRKLVHRGKRKVEDYIREELWSYVSSAEELAEEQRFLGRYFSPG